MKLKKKKAVPLFITLGNKEIHLILSYLGNKVNTAMIFF